MPLFHLHSARALATARGAAWRLISTALLLAGLALPGGGPALAAVPAQAPLTAPQGGCALQVSTSSNAGAGSLREAVACAAAGQTVTFAAGLAGQTIPLTTGEIAITTRLTIDASGAPGVKVDGGNLSRIFNITTTLPVTLTAFTVQRGASGATGGAITAVSTRLLLTGMAVLSSTATGNGGGVASTGEVRTVNSLFQNNRCTGGSCEGGALRADTLNMNTTQVISNTGAGPNGGGVSLSSFGTVRSSTFQRNNCTGAACQGGAFYTADGLISMDTSFIDNHSLGDGGAIFNVTGMDVRDGRFERNSCSAAACVGGGANSNGTTTIRDSLFISNTSQARAGGIYALFGYVRTVTFQGNSCAGVGCKGGAIVAQDYLTMGNVTLSGNSAGSGGAIYLIGPAVSSLRNVTVANNTAPTGGGLTAEISATVEVINGLFSNNGANTCAGQIDSGSNNIEWTGGACAAVGPTAGFTTTNPLLAALALNVPGSLPTHALPAGSPAIDTGDAATCAGDPVYAVDERGVERPVDGDGIGGAVCDLGAFEYTPPCTLLVSLTADDGDGSLRHAVDCAFPGDTVTFAPGLAGQTISLTSGEIPIPSAMTIDGSGAPGVKIDAGSLSRIFSTTLSIEGTITLTALTLQRGASSDRGGAVASPVGTLVLNQVNVFSSTATVDGGAVWAAENLIVQGGLIRGNVSGSAGGGLVANDLTLSGTQVISNSTQLFGGGVYLKRGSLTNGYFERNNCEALNCFGGGLFRQFAPPMVALTNTVFLSNTADLRGGGLYALGAIRLVNGRFEGNGCNLAIGCQGAGLYSEDPISLTGTQFLRNAGFLSGAGLYAEDALSITGGLFQANTCTYFACEGGGLYAAGTLSLTGTQFLSNTSRLTGGGVAAAGAATLSGGVFQGNSCTLAGCQGGGLYAAGTLALAGTQFLSNTSLLAGGGAYAVGAATVAGARFQGNGCLTAGCLGGGLYPVAGGAIAGSTFAGNTADIGAGVIITGAANVTLSNSTLAANVADVAGGALFVGGTSTARLVNLTVANNQAPVGGGLRSVPAATVGITNSIFSLNGDLNCLGPIDGGSHNLEWSDATCGAAGPAAGFTLVNPLLGPLALNAPGSTQTFALLDGSPAIDAGEAASCAGSPVNNLDQRGVPRPLDGDEVAGAVCDIGAYEAPALPLPPEYRLYLPLMHDGP